MSMTKGGGAYLDDDSFHIFKLLHKPSSPLKFLYIIVNSELFGNTPDESRGNVSNIE
ncbi:hypothetical protein EUBDOL_01770 [Amedibacillus dolichus DSM 3991]|uniref:Uncharacterized protein n=1 Tax=Amedibacillus dolichus DSM 3991 TaxID=428127 RepID=A8REE3_9FIRM|nr:hypothetical protein EUBDOL_01770 [Amedibacillus dolichus DSM 3991]